MRIGHGYDVHRLAEGRRLVLGGVEIPFGRGLEGHSDADVLTHALMDALLGAMGLGDIGQHFPDTDDRYKNIDSLLLLAQVTGLLHEGHWQAINADCTIITQRPKLAPYLPAMAANLARVLKIAPEDVNIKATTEEGLGFTGREEGIAAHAVCLLEKIV